MLLWDSKMATGVSWIDDQHKEFLRRFASIMEAREQERSHSEIASLLNFLVDYANEHFQAEESLMRSLSYPELSDHQAVHQELKKDCENFYRQYLDEGVSVDLFDNIMASLIEWLVHHILNDDIKMAVFLRQNKNF